MISIGHLFAGAGVDSSDPSAVPIERLFLLLSCRGAIDILAMMPACICCWDSSSSDEESKVTPGVLVLVVDMSVLPHDGLFQSNETIDLEKLRKNWTLDWTLDGLLIVVSFIAIDNIILNFTLRWKHIKPMQKIKLLTLSILFTHIHVKTFSPAVGSGGRLLVRVFESHLFFEDQFSQPYDDDDSAGPFSRPNPRS